jgi:hypothetical protein
MPIKGVITLIKKAFLSYSSPLILMMATLSVQAKADSSATDASNPYYVQAQDDVDTTNTSSVPKLSADQVSSVLPQSGNEPYRLANGLGLSKDSRFKMNGFVSAGAAHTSSKKDYQIPGHGTVGNNVNFNALSLLGMQVTANLNKRLSVVAQVLANGDSTNGNTAYSAQLDYGFVRYAINDSYEVRAGRFRLPAFLFSSTQEIGYSFPWVVLPNEVYRIVPFNNINGFDTLARYAVGKSGWNITLEPYVGSSRSKFDLYNSSLPSDTYSTPTAKFEENSLFGIVAEASNKYVTLRGTYAHLSLTGDVDFFESDDAGSGSFLHNQFVKNQEDYFYSFGTKVNYKGLQFASEFAHRQTPAPLASLSGVYGMLGYKFLGFLPNFTYSRLWTTNKDELLGPDSSSTTPLTSTELAQKQESYTLGLDYYLNNNLVFKGSIADVRPLGGTRGLFDTVEPSALKRNNMLYMVGVDAIF